ncbi:cytosine-purine permease [Peniophora sp. CONT]|nr:cytosine-purine permease [Peniophora sp. CONT]
MEKQDVEAAGPDPVLSEKQSIASGEVPLPTTPTSRFQRLTNILKTWGVETNGIEPIPIESRTERRTYQFFFLWLSTNLSVLTVSTGVSGPAFFSLGRRDSLVIILVVDLTTCLIPAYFAAFGPKLGTRAMVQGRFSWGFYGGIIPSLFNIFSLQGYLVLNAIIGGQLLASVSSHLNDTLGIVIISVISLAVTFAGYRVLHIYEQYAWIPNFLAFLTMLGAGAKHIVDVDTPTATPANVLSFASLVCISVYSWCTMSPDYGVYHAPAPTWKIMLYVYLGFLCGSMPGHMIGAAFAAGAPAVPAWQAGLGADFGNVGGLVGAVLFEAGGWGKFLAVICALTIPSAVAPTMYSFGTSFMTVTPILARLPRYTYAFVATAILIPVAVVGANSFYDTFVDIISVIGYWSAGFAGIVMADHSIIRRGRWSSYRPVEDWDNPRVLPLGFAAIFAFLCAVGIIVPSMSQVYYVGPIAAAGAGDIGIWLGFTVAALVYVPCRLMEMQLEKRLGRGGAVHL